MLHAEHTSVPVQEPGAQLAPQPPPHTDETDAPTMVENVPEGQFVHDVAPVMVEYVLAEQELQNVLLEAFEAVEYVPMPQLMHE